MKTILYVKENLIMKKVLAIAILVLGLAIFLFENFFVGLIILIIGINLIATEGSEINLESKTYRTIKSIFGLKFGKWKPCPEFEYVSVFKTRESTEVRSHAATMATFSNEIIVLNLFYNRNKHITFYQTYKKADAFEVANHFKLAFDIDVLDATESESKWL